jgi:glycosyltransferase involved in cell wall biosynthesis
MRPRLCFVGTTRYPVPLDRSTARKFAALAPLGDAVVVAFAGGLRPRHVRDAAELLLLPNLPGAPLRVLLYLTAVPWLVLWLVWSRGVDVLIAQSPYEAVPAALAKGLARLLGRRIVLVVESHGDFEVSLFLQRRIRGAAVYRFLMRRACRFAFRHGDLFRAISTFTREQVARWAPGRAVLQFPTWSDLDVFFAATEPAAEAPVVLYAGLLIPRKGVHHLLHAFGTLANAFPDATLVLAGAPGDAAYADALAVEAERRLPGRVRFLGHVEPPALAAWMRRARVVVLPSLSEGLGRVVIEAMATGTPVIGSRVGGIPDLVTDGVTGFLVPAGDEAALAERVRRLLADADAARAMGARGRAFVEPRFSTRTFVEGYASVLGAAQTLLGSR